MIMMILSCLSLYFINVRIGQLLFICLRVVFHRNLRRQEEILSFQVSSGPILIMLWSGWFWYFSFAIHLVSFSWPLEFPRVLTTSNIIVILLSYVFFFFFCGGWFLCKFSDKIQVFVSLFGFPVYTLWEYTLCTCCVFFFLQGLVFGLRLLHPFVS